MTLIDQNTVGFWYAGFAAMYWSALLIRKDDSHFSLTITFNHYRSDEVIGSQDIREIENFRIKDASEQNVLEKVRQMYQWACENGAAPTWEVLKGEKSMEEFIEALRAMPGVTVNKRVNDVKH